MSVVTFLVTAVSFIAFKAQLIASPLPVLIGVEEIISAAPTAVNLCSALPSFFVKYCVIALNIYTGRTRERTP